jgi:predicted Zn-dependent protease
MKKAIFFDLLKLVFVFVGIWAVFTFLPVFNLNKEDLTLSIDNEEKLGKIIVAHLLSDKSKIRLLKNPQVDSAVAVIVKRLTDSMGPTDYEYKIKVLDVATINAFTLPGGNIFLYSGLIKFSEHPEEVAAVLAHEIGHAEKKHVVAKLIKEMGIAALFSVLGKGESIVLGEISKTATSTVFDRAQEKEADDFAFSLLEKSHINPKALATFFRKLNREQGSYDENLEILMTHPNTNSRIKASLEYKVASTFVAKEIVLNWPSVQSQIGQGDGPPK